MLRDNGYQTVPRVLTIFVFVFNYHTPCHLCTASTVSMNSRPKTTSEQGDSREEPSELRLSIDNVEIKVPLDETTKRETKDFLDELYRASAMGDDPEGRAESGPEIGDASSLELGFKIEEAGGLMKEERKMSEKEDGEDGEDWDLEGLSSTEISRSPLRLRISKKFERCGISGAGPEEFINKFFKNI